MSVFDELRKEHDNEDGSSVVEQHLFVIAHESQDSEDIVFKQHVNELAGEEGILKSTRHEIREAGCCGAFVAYDTDTKHKTPAGRCRSCRALLCNEHMKQLQCTICFKSLCVACARTVNGMTFCATHYTEIAQEAHEKEVKECLTNPTKPRQH